MTIPHFTGWHLLGSFPDPEDDGVGSWLLAHGGDALLSEIPPGLSVSDVRSALATTGTDLRFVTASHDHEDHLDPETWDALAAAFPGAEFIPPSSVAGDRLLSLAGEPLWLVKAPKHSKTDVVTVFRGVAMTGDIELGMLASVNREVPARIKRASMKWLREFPVRTGYHVHSTVSAHLNDVRTSVDWSDLFDI